MRIPYFLEMVCHKELRFVLKRACHWKLLNFPNFLIFWNPNVRRGYIFYGIYFASWLFIHYLYGGLFKNSVGVSLLMHKSFREVTLNSASISQFHYEFIWWIKLWFREFDINFEKIQWIHYLFHHLFYLKLLSVSQIHYESPFFF